MLAIVEGECVKYAFLEVIKRIPLEYGPYVVVGLLAVGMTLVYVKLRGALNDINKLKTEGHKCIHKDMIDRVGALEVKFVDMEERQDKIDVEFASINTKLIAIDRTTSETKEMFKNLNDKLFQVVLDKQKN